MAHIVILGAGTGGMAGAYEMREHLGRDHQITLINERSSFQFVPSNPWLAVGRRSRKQISFEAEPYLKKKKIAFIAQRADKIDPQANSITLANGETLNYDYLVVATGPKLNFAPIEGSGPDVGFTQSICTLDHAEQAFADFEKLVSKPGPVIIGALPGASCFGPAYEYAMIVDAELKKRKIRDQVPMWYITPEPYIGHLGLAGVGDSKGMLESEFRSRHINWKTNAKVTRIEAGKMFFDVVDDTGETVEQHELEFNHSMMLPPFAGVDAVATVADLCNEKGFVKVDEYQRSPKYSNIFAVGVCVAIPPVEVTPVPCGTPKTGYMIESMMTAVVHNIGDAIDGKEASHTGTWNAFCLADMGDTGAAFVAVPQIPPRNITWFKKGRWVHWAKIVFEKYFLYKMKAGKSEPTYEKYVLKLMGINRLKDKN